MAGLTPERISRIREQMHFDIRTSGWKDLAEELLDEREALLSELATARQERDIAQANLEMTQRNLADADEQLVVVRRQLAELAEALRKIAVGGHVKTGSNMKGYENMATGDPRLVALAEIARAALDVVQGGAVST